MNKIKILALILAVSFVSGCILQTTYSTVTLNGKPAQISLAETECCFDKPLELSVNGEVLGLLEADLEKKEERKYKPLKTKYGTITGFVKDDLTLVNPRVWIDMYLDGQYIGMVPWLN